MPIGYLLHRLVTMISDNTVYVQLGLYITVAAACRGLWLTILLPIIVRHLKPKSADVLPVPTSSVPPADNPSSLPHSTHSPSMIHFDLLLARLSLAADASAYYTTYFASTGLGFTVVTSACAFGGGMLPACQSVMLSLAARSAQVGGEGVGAGRMLGAIAMLQAAGQTIFGVRRPSSNCTPLESRLMIFGFGFVNRF